MKFAVLNEATATGWSAYLPDLPGCVAAAATRAETENLIARAVELNVAQMRADGDPIPVAAEVGLVEVS